MSDYLKPCLKPHVEFCSFNKKIYFFQRPGVAIQMEDPSGFITAVCNFMDSKKSVAELSQNLIPLFPKETPYLRSLLIALDQEYLLEDSTQNHPGNLTDYDVIRWSRNIEFFGAHSKATDNKYVYQEKLKSIKVVILGLGGVGSNILYNLVAMGVHNIKAVDFDKVELSNLNRQIIYNESDLGQLKSEAAKNRISQFTSHINIEFINKKISCSEDIAEIVVGQDIVISAIDFPREKIMDWVNEACIKQNVPFLCGSLDSRLVTYYTIIPGKTGCIECWKASADKSTFLFQDLIQHESFVSSSSPNIAIMPLISLVSGLVANEFLKIVTGIAEPQSLGQLCTFDFVSSQTAIAERWEKNSNCSVCSKN